MDRLSPHIMKRIATGDKTAVGDCLDEYGSMIWSMTRLMISSAAEAEDAVCDIFLEIWKTAEKFDEKKCSEKIFTATITLREILRSLQVKNDKIFNGFSSDLIGYFEYDNNNLREPRKFGEIIAQLDAGQRKFLLLSIFQVFSLWEISELLSISPASVKKQVRFALDEVNKF